MPQFKRVGYDHTAEMPEDANPEFWERVDQSEITEAPAPESTEAPAPEGSES